MIVSLQDISKYYGSDLIFKNVTAKIEDTDRIGLVGANGAGKTTLLNIITGNIDNDDGELSVRRDAKIGYQKQNSGLHQSGTVISEMKSVFSRTYELSRELEILQKEMSEHPEDKDISERYYKAETEFLAKDGYNADVKIRMVLTGMGFGEDVYDKTIDCMSGGEQTRLSIAKLLLMEPQLLILDEPTNHLDFKTLSWLEDYLTKYKGAILTVSHDRYFLNKICDKIWELDRGELTVFPGNYTKYLELKEERDAHLLKVYKQQQEELAHLEDYVNRNLVRASTTKMAQSRQKMIERLEPAEKPKAPIKKPKIRLRYAEDPVKDVLIGEGVGLAVNGAEGRRQLLTGADFTVRRGDKVAVIGGNGVGKTTLLKVIMGDDSFKTAGNIRWGRGTKLSYYEQGSEGLDVNKTVLETMSDLYPRSYESALRSMLGAMGIQGEDVFKPVGQLSGGERARVKLSAICLADSNVLILDEPTNHLDLATKEVLEDALKAFEGTVIMVSHDRYLLDSVPNKIWAIEDGVLTEYKGRYSDYINSAKPAAEKPVIQEAKQETAANKAYKGGKQARREEAMRRSELAALEQSIAKCEAEAAELDKALADPATSADYNKLQEICERKAQLTEQIAQETDRWLELSM